MVKKHILYCGLLLQLLAYVSMVCCGDLAGSFRGYGASRGLAQESHFENCKPAKSPLQPHHSTESVKDIGGEDEQDEDFILLAAALFINYIPSSEKYDFSLHRALDQPKLVNLPPPKFFI